MPSKVGKASRLARVSVASTRVIINDVSLGVTADRAKFANLYAENGVSFAGDNTVIRNDLLDKIDQLVALFGATFTRDTNDRLVLSTSNYSTHTHAFEDTTINDTDDGTGVSTDTTKETNGVS